jgi:hypothetical protein
MLATLNYLLSCSLPVTERFSSLESKSGGKRETTGGGWVVLSVVLVGIRATFEEERGYEPVDGLDGPADGSPSHSLFFFPFLSFLLFNLVFVYKSA